MPYSPRSPPQAPCGPNGMIASVATAVVTMITGAIAIIHGTAVAGCDCSFDSSFRASASGCIRPYGPTRLGP